MPRVLTPAAQVAKRCREYLKGRGIPASVTSSNYSMGNSVTVRVTDLSPRVRKEIENELKMYQSGSFNSSEEIYEYSNHREDIPQTKYLSVDNHYSDERKQAAWNFLRQFFSGYESFPVDYKEVEKGHYCRDRSHYDVNLEVLHILNGADVSGSKAFYQHIGEYVEELESTDVDEGVA